LIGEGNDRKNIRPMTNAEYMLLWRRDFCI
jgi:hypothetical protein